MALSDTGHGFNHLEQSGLHRFTRCWLAISCSLLLCLGVVVGMFRRISERAMSVGRGVWTNAIGGLRASRGASRWRRKLVTMAAIVPLGAASLGLLSAATPAGATPTCTGTTTVTCTLSYTGAVDSFTVPIGVTSVTISAAFSGLIVGIRS